MGGALPPFPLSSMVFLIKFRRSDAVTFERKIESLPVVARDRDEAKSIFNKFLGNPYNYPILDVSVLEYEK